MERIPEKVDSKFRYVLLASHRAEQLMRGANTKLPNAGGKVTRTAMEEIIEDAVKWDYGPEPPAAGLAAEGESEEAVEAESLEA